MITAWMLYSLLLGAMLAIGALLADRASTAARLPRRFAWMGALALLIVLTALAPWRRAERAVVPDSVLPATTVASSATVMPSPVSLRERIVDLLVYPTRHGIDDISARVPDSLDRAVGALWLLASAASLLTLLGVLRKLDRQRRAWPQATLHGQRVRVAAQHGPAVYGVLNPDIVLPTALLSLPAVVQQLVLSHEAEHRRARDPLMLSAAALATALIPWHPIAWWLASRLRLAVELDCDARVLRSGASPRKYGELLLSLSESLPTRQRSLHALALLDSPRHLERRLLAMTSRTSRRAPLAITGLLLAGAAVVVAACSTDVPTAAQVRDADAGTVTRTLGIPEGDGIQYVVDGKPVTEAAAKQVRPEDIASISVTGDAVALRGEKVKASGDAEVRIITHGYAVDSDTLPRKQRMLLTGDSVRSVDSVKFFGRDTFMIRADNISYVMGNVKMRSDTMPFSRRKITYQRDSTSFSNDRMPLGADSMKSPSVLYRRSATAFGDTAVRILTRSVQPSGGEPLLIIDGVRSAAGMTSLQSLDPNDIASIEVVKGAAAVRTFGNDAVYGAIVVSTKRSRQRP